ncbi:TPA: hypothetical protein P6J92_001887 [Staphylococcus aureus]|nr:hypothetical protein [Staphylococcus aureus]
MEKNESNITDVTQNEEQLDNSDEQSQQNEKTFSQEEVSQLIKERIARERKKSDKRIKFISKTEHFKEKVMKKLIENLLIEKSLDVISTKDIERLLKELYNNDNIIYRNR